MAFRNRCPILFLPGAEERHGQGNEPILILSLTSQSRPTLVLTQAMKKQMHRPGLELAAGFGQRTRTDVKVLPLKASFPFSPRSGVLTDDKERVGTSRKKESSKDQLRHRAGWL